VESNTITGLGSVQQIGTGATTLTGDNTYSGGTTISAGTLYVNNTSGSGTGSGSVLVQSGGTLAGSGTISGAVTVQSGGKLASGPAQTNVVSPSNAGGVDTVSGPGLTADLAVNGGATLQFDLGAGADTNATPGVPDYANPNLNSTSLTSTGPVMFGTTGGNVNVSLVDLTAFSLTDTLQLRYQNPYLLISAGGLDSNYNLVTTGGYDQDGLVLGIGSADTGTQILNSFTLSAQDINGGNLAIPYNNLQLYLYEGNLEVIPEPGTWALMLGGLALLVLIQRRRRDGTQP
jgi:autotransporter-associated beta strand protein